MQTASVAWQTELAGYAAYGESLAVQAVELRAAASALRRAERAECAADGESFAVQPVVFRADRFDYAAGGSSWMRIGQQEPCRARG